MGSYAYNVFDIAFSASQKVKTSNEIKNTCSKAD